MCWNLEIETLNIFLPGHSLGAGVAVLLALMIRPTYPKLKVYAFATPGMFQFSLSSIQNAEITN